MAKVNITLQTFMSMTNSKGEYKTWGDMRDGGYLGNLVNTEVLGSILRAPQEIVGENLIYEYKTFRNGKVWDDNVSNSTAPTLNRVVFNMPQDRNQFSYKMSLFGEKEAIAWSFYIGEEDGNIWKQIMNENNTVALEAVKDYAIATGQFKLLTNLGTNGKTNDEYFNDTALISDTANAIMSTQTAVNLGLNPERLKIYVAPNVMRQITTGIAGTNVSQGAYNDLKLGQIKNLFGYDWERTIYLGQKFEIVATKPKDFTNVLGIVYNLDSLAFYQQTPKTTNFPSDAGNIVRSFGWKPFAAMLPSMEHTSAVLVKTLPTIDEVNKARTKLATAQPGVYGKLPGGALTTITTEEYNVMKANASKFEVGFTPNVELPTASAKKTEETKTGMFNRTKTE